MISSRHIPLLACLATTLASPTPKRLEVVDEIPIPSLITSEDQLNSLVSSYTNSTQQLDDLNSQMPNILNAIVPAAAPSSIADEISKVAAVYAQNLTFLEEALDLVLEGLTPDPADLLDIFQGETVESSQNNINPINPAQPVYPKKSNQDAPYSLSEEELRRVIYIPPGFSYGQRAPPLVMVPGTGGYAGEIYASNYGKLFADVDYADPVYVNVPNFSLGDIQVNSEYVAYAINYISGISNNQNVSVLGWSQGSLTSQWAFQYWPSTRNVTTDFIAQSGDLKGTVLAYFIQPFPGFPADPAIFQQESTSNFIATLRNGGGSSAYVPTTAVWSAFDEIVQPQQGPTASAVFLDARNVGVSNTEVQIACPGQPAGGLYGHEGVLYNPLAYALTVDALTHDGPGELSRINTTAVCEMIASPGLTLEDVLATEAVIPIALLAILASYPEGEVVESEPAIMPYAQGGTPA